MRGMGLMSDGKGLYQPVLVRLRVSEPALPYDHEKTTEIDWEVWDSLDPEGRREHIDALADDFAREIYETDWEIESDHDIDALGTEE